MSKSLLNLQLLLHKSSVSRENFTKSGFFTKFTFTKSGVYCILLNLDLNFAGNNNASGSMIDDKSKQWFGASVHSSGPDGIIVVNLNVLIGENNLALSVLL